jgi:hypothetical protein
MFSFDVQVQSPVSFEGQKVFLTSWGRLVAKANFC